MGRTSWELDGMLVLSPGEQGLTARVLLLEDEFVIETADGERETWGRNVISANPYDTKTMQLGLGDSTLYFQADEPLEFAEHLAEYVEAPRKRRKRKSHNGKVSAPTPAPDLQPEPKVATVSSDAISQKRQRFGRSEHVHTWQTHAIGGGIARSVCTPCGAITIDLTTTYEFTGDPTALLTRRR